MAKRTYELAVNYAYKGIKEGDVPSQEYLTTRYEICKRQIALAGYRLADFLKGAFAAGGIPEYYDLKKVTYADKDEKKE